LFIVYFFRQRCREALIISHLPGNAERFFFSPFGLVRELQQVSRLYGLLAVRLQQRRRYPPRPFPFSAVMLRLLPAVAVQLTPEPVRCGVQKLLFG
jgi:hypothetical protein